MMNIFNLIHKVTTYFLLSIALISCTNDAIIHEWTPTFDGNSTEPFGCKLMDSTLSVIFRQDSSYYNVKALVDEKETLKENGDQLWTDLDNIYFDNDMIYLLVERIRKGYSTIFVSETFNEHIETSTDNFDFKRFVKEFNSQGKYKKSVIVNEATDKNYEFPKSFCIKHFFDYSVMNSFNDAEKQIIARVDGQPIAIRYKYRNGACVLLISTPLLFTNYGILHNDNAELIVDLINQAEIKDGLTRIFYQKNEFDSQQYKSQIQSESTDFSFMKDLIKALAIRIAIILGILIFILFLLFSAKRRQRMIPIIQPPYNKTLDFFRQVSKLYFWKNDYTNMTRKKIVYFFFFLNEKLHIQIDDESRISENCCILSAMANTPQNTTEKLVRNLLKIHTSTVICNEQDMKYYINQMNNILQKLK